MSINSGSKAPAAIRRKSSPGLWNTFQTPKIAPKTNHRSIRASLWRRGRVESRVHERVGIRVLGAWHMLQVDLVVGREHLARLLEQRSEVWLLDLPRALHLLDD